MTNDCAWEVDNGFSAEHNYSSSCQQSQRKIWRDPSAFYKESIPTKPIKKMLRKMEFVFKA